MSMGERARKDVLVVDGVEFYRRMLGELLASQGYRVTEAADGAAARERLERGRPDLAIIDLDVAPRGGAALLAELSERHLGPAAAVALAAREVSDPERLRQAGFGAWVLRSSPIDDLLAATRGALFPEAKNLRRSPRAQVHVPVAYRVVDGPGEALGDCASHSFNLSADGMFIVATTVAPSPPGSRLELSFWLPGADDVIRAGGVVVWCNQPGGRINELYPPGMGVMFLGLVGEAAAVVNDYVRERSFGYGPFR